MVTSLAGIKRSRIDLALWRPGVGRRHPSTFPTWTNGISCSETGVTAL